MALELIDQDYLEKIMDGMGAASMEPPEGGSALDRWAQLHKVDVTGLIMLLEKWTAEFSRQDRGSVTQACYWLQVGYEARRQQVD